LWGFCSLHLLLHTSGIFFFCYFIGKNISHKEIFLFIFTKTG